ncbi:MAG: hypothetical protein R2807_01165 [Chitinophagales bacterium]
MQKQSVDVPTFSESSLLNRAISLAYYELIGDANLINTEDKKYEAIKAQDIQRFAQNTFNKNSSNTLYYLKKDAQSIIQN